jgi:GT2 family glycosyltransferase
VTEVLPVSVVIPTVGRPALLQSCLESLAACDPRADETIVIDQSGRDSIPKIVERFATIGARVVSLDVRNKSLALNLGLEKAQHAIVLVTDDDCTVAPSWIGVAWTRMAADPNAVVTGRVIPFGEPFAVPSTIEEVAPRDYTGELHYGALYGGNMACNGSVVLAFGGFDEQLRAAEDNDFCYRWLRSGRRLRYEPELIVWHHGWRTRADLNRLYLTYGHGQGVFYAKHLRGGDLAIARFVARDLYRGGRGIAARIIRRERQWPDPRAGLLRGLVLGLLEGWKAFSPRSSVATGTRPLGSGDDAP